MLSCMARKMSPACKYMASACWGSRNSNANSAFLFSGVGRSRMYDIYWTLSTCRCEFRVIVMHGAYSCHIPHLLLHMHLSSIELSSASSHSWQTRPQSRILQYHMMQSHDMESYDSHMTILRGWPWQTCRDVWLPPSLLLRHADGGEWGRGRGRWPPVHHHYDAGCNDDQWTAATGDSWRNHYTRKQLLSRNYSRISE